MPKTALELSPLEWKQYSLPQRSVGPEVSVRWEEAWRLIPEVGKAVARRVWSDQDFGVWFCG